MAYSQEMHPANNKVFHHKMPVFDGTVSSSVLPKPLNMSHYLGKQLLQYNGAYYVYDPQGKDMVPYTSPWSDSKTSVLADGRGVSHRSGTETERGAFHRQGGNVSPQDHATRSVSPRAPAKQGFQAYAKSSAATAPVSIRRETPPARSEKQSYLAVPKPVYAHSRRCCDDVACARGRYSVETGFPGMLARQAHYVQTDPRYGETSAFQKKPADTVLQCGALQFEPSGGLQRRMSAKYGPGGAAPYSTVPSYKTYPSSLLPTLFNPSSEQREHKSVRGFPYVYPSHYTYEHKTSDVYQEHSPMAKYGHATQQPVFYCAQPDVEVEKRTQRQDDGSQTRGDAPVVPKRPVHYPQEHYGSPHLLHADASANPAFVPGLSLNYYSFPRFHSAADQCSAPSQTPDMASDCSDDGSSGFCIDYSKFSVINVCPEPALQGNLGRPSTPEPPVLIHRTSESDVSPKTQNNRHCDPYRYQDHSSCEGNGSAGTRPTCFSRDGSDETHSVIQKGLNARKIIYSPPVSAAHRRNATLPFTGSRLKVAPKRSRSCSFSPIKIKREREERPDEVEFPPKMKEVETEMVQLRNESPPLPVISDVFSLAPYKANLQAYERSTEGKLPPTTVKSDHCGSRGEQDSSEERLSQDKKQLIFQTKLVEEILEAKKIKEEEDLPNQDVCEETSVCPQSCSNVAVKREAEESGCDCDHILESTRADPGTRVKLQTFADPKKTPVAPALVKIIAQIDSPPVEGTSTRHRRLVMLQPGVTTPPPNPPPPPLPPPPTKAKVDFKNIPLHCLKLTTYRLLLPKLKLSGPAQPPENQKPSSPAQPPENQKPSGPVPPPENQKPSSLAQPPENQKPSSPAPLPENQKPSSPAPPPENQKLSSLSPSSDNQIISNLAPPPEYQKLSRLAPSPKNQILSNPAPPPEYQKPSTPAPPPKNRKLYRPGQPPNIEKPSIPAGPPDSTKAKAENSPKPKAENPPKPGLQMPVRKHFFELHLSLYRLINKSVLASSEEALRTWLSQLDLAEAPPPNAKLQRLSCLLGTTARVLWFNEEIKSALRDLLQRLKEYIVQDRCPFPHVIRAGAVFLPMLVIKEQLFPMVQSNYIDQVLQEHRIELRPATLSEEKILIQLHKRACSSRLRKLMSLKHLPDIYADVTNVLYYCCVTKYLGLDRDDCVVKEEPLEGAISAVTVVDDIDASPASPADSPSPEPVTNRKATRNRTKSRIKSSSRRMFLDDSLSDEEKVEVSGGGGLYQNATRGCESGRTEAKSDDRTDADKIPSRSPPISTSDNSWMCPLTFEDLPPSPGTPDAQDPKCSGVVLKLRRMFCCKRKKARYQAVPDTSASDPGDGSHGARKWRRAGRFLHAATTTRAAPSPARGSSRRKQSSFLKVKCCSYLSAERRRRLALRQAAGRLRYPDLVGKKIRHLYEEDDKSEVWYRGEVLRVHEAHSNPLKTIFEVRYDSEPEWRYFLELLIDYEKGWLTIEP